jgi:parallel beta-helix repeat protein
MRANRPAWVWMLGLVCMCLCVRAARAQTVLYVDENATGPTHDGSNWCYAYLEVFEALNAAGSGCTIRVADGTYLPDTSGLADPREATFSLLTGVTIEGGYAGCGAAYPDNRDTEATPTILSGDLNGDDGPDFAYYDENVYHVVTGSGTDATAIMDGLVIRGGNADGDMGTPQAYGAGMHVVEGSPTVEDCTFTENRAIYGGGVCNEGSSTALISCTLEDNYAGWGGGGVCNVRHGGTWSRLPVGYPTFTDCIIKDNTASVRGGGISNLENQPVLEGCTLIGNSAAVGGGLYIHIAVSRVDMDDCLFVGNSATGSVAGQGGAIYVSSGAGLFATSCILSGNTAMDGGAGLHVFQSNPFLTNCTLSGNATTTGGAGVYVASGKATLSQCILWGNTGAEVAGTVNVTYSDVQGGCAGTGNINEDPTFVDADGADNVTGTEDDDLHLSTGSPCINAGDADFSAPGARDIDGEVRVMDCRVDMGADEYTSGYPIDGDFDRSGAVDIADVPLFADALLQSTREDRCLGDMNGDYLLDGLDIQPFLDAIIP